MRGRWYCIDGNVYESVVDLRVPCPNTDLVFRRVYGSWSMDAGTLGYGWTHGYEWRLSVSNGSDRVVVRSAGEGIDNLLAVKIGGESYYPLTDIQGTVWGYVDSQNNLVARCMYGAWGNVLSEYCAVPTLASVRYRFQCREWSATTGLTNFRMRWYDAETGRWLSKDPIGLSGGPNLYAFCENQPNLYVDSYGLDSVAWAAVCGFAEGFGKGAAAAIDVIIPFGDPFSGFYTDECGNLDDDSLRISQGFGEVSREALYTAAGLRGAAALSSLKHFRFLNQNRYIRIGKGNIPRGRPFTDGPGQNVPTLRIGNGKPSPINHIDLRLWGY